MTHIRHIATESVAFFGSYYCFVAIVFVSCTRRVQIMVIVIPFGALLY